jgi:hypothetical protein
MVVKKVDSSDKNIQILCEKSLEYILLNRKGNLKLDSNMYFLLLIVYNM